MTKRKPVRVRIKGWSTSREVFEENGKILFEIAETDGCPTCQRRIDHVRRTLARKNIQAKFLIKKSRWGDCLYVALDKPQKGKHVKKYVRETLDIPII